jgi:hypothetical protein
MAVRLEYDFGAFDDKIENMFYFCNMILQHVFSRLLPTTTKRKMEEI